MVDQIRDEETLRTAARLLESENRRLIKLVMDLQRQIAELGGKSPEALQQRLALLEQQLAQKNAQLFAPSSERRDANQGDNSDAKESKEKRRGHGHKPQPALPIVEHVVDLPKDDRTCTACGGELTEMSGQSETSEEIDVIERRFVVKKIVRKKYRCSCNACIKTAPAPSKLVAGGRYSIGFAIEAAVQKYAYHMPLTRIARQMGHDGLDIDSQTLWDQIELLARVIRKVPNRIHAYVLSQPVVGVDETRWPLMTDKGRVEGDAKAWYAWAAAAPNAVHYTIAAGRSADVADTVLTAYGGIVMADGYDVYESLRKRRSHPYTLANCWVHVRRKFVQIESFYPEQTEKILGLIGQLYEIEARALVGPPDTVLERLRTLRDVESRAVVKRISEWAMTTDALPQSTLGQALAYMGNCWKGLVRFLDDPRIPLDNNATERALRGPVVGRKNHYGSRSRRGTEIAALYYTLIESAKLSGLDPRKYLRHASEVAMKHETVLLPHEFAARFGSDVEETAVEQ